MLERKTNDTNLPKGKDEYLLTGIDESLPTAIDENLPAEIDVNLPTGIDVNLLKNGGGHLPGRVKTICLKVIHIKILLKIINMESLLE